MDIFHALLRSNCHMARRHAKGRPSCEILARARQLDVPPMVGVRIVASFTDPTVLRKLSEADLRSDKWEPVNK